MEPSGEPRIRTDRGAPPSGDAWVDVFEAVKDGGKKAIAVAIRGKDGDLLLEGKGMDLEALREVLKGRGNIVMTRVGDEDLAAVDLLVEAGLFASRSECAAFLIRQGLEARKGMLERVRETAEKIRQLKEKAKKEIGG